jgi:hypothetical protein
MAWGPSARGAYMLRKFVCVGFHSSPGEGALAVMISYYKNPMAWGTYMLRSSFVLVFIRLRVSARSQS